MIAAMRSARSLVAGVLLGALLLAGAGLAQTGRPAGSLDVIIRHGTVLDGSGRAGFIADVGVRGGYVVAVGDLGAARAATENRGSRPVRRAWLHQHPQSRGG
jgi:hypothetical protein